MIERSIAAWIGAIHAKLARLQALVDPSIAEVITLRQRHGRHEIYHWNYPFDLKHNKHHYQLGSPLSEGQIRTIETHYRFQVPDGYRRFLLEVGDGGYGPFNGLRTLERAIADSFADEAEAETHLPCPFPHDSATGRIDQRPASFPDDDSWRDHVESASFVSGSLCLSHYGRTIENRLIVTGDLAGQFWIDDRGADGGVFPITLDNSLRLLGHKVADHPDLHRPAEFLSWYDLWLEAELQGAERLAAGRVVYRIASLEPDQEGAYAFEQNRRFSLADIELRPSLPADAPPAEKVKVVLVDETQET